MKGFEAIEIDEFDLKSLSNIVHIFETKEGVFIRTFDFIYKVVPKVVLYEIIENQDDLTVVTIDNKKAKPIYDVDWQAYYEIKKALVAVGIYDADLQGYKKIIRTLGPKNFALNAKCLFFDIEVDYSLDTINTPDPIIVIAAISLDRTFKKTWSLDLYFEKGKIVDDEVIQSEKKMLEEVLDTLAASYANTAYNVFGYDLPYLANRYRKLHGHDHWSVIRDWKDRPKILTSPTFDFKDLIKKMAGGIKKYIKDDAKKAFPKNYRLNEIAKYVLDDTKIEIDLQNAPLEKIIEYCEYDVELMIKLEERLNAVYGHYIMHYITGLNLDDIWDANIVDAMLTKFYKDVPFPPKKYNKKQEYQGAIVFDPIPGIYTDVKVLDFSSMYVNIIIENDLSPVRYKGKGILKPLLIWLVDNRKKYQEKSKKYPEKKLLYETLALKLKTIGNTAYGAPASHTFRLYNPKYSSIVTSKGREAMQTLKKICESLGLQVIYGDTDSGFVRCSEEHISLINEQLKLSLGERMQIKIDKDFDLFIIGKKKKMYTGIDSDGKFIQAGWLKGNTPLVVRKAAVSFVKKLAECKPITTKEIRKVYNECVDMIKQTQDVEAFSIASDISKDLDEYTVDSMHVRAQKNGNKKVGFKKYGKHNPAPYVITIYNKPHDVMPYDLVEINDVHIEDYVNRFNKLLSILMYVPTNMSLEEFF